MDWKKRDSFLLLLSLVLCLWLITFRPVPLGLDLKGGVEFLLEPDYSSTLSSLLEEDSLKIEKLLREEAIPFLKVLRVDNKIVIKTIKNGKKIYEFIQKKFKNYRISYTENEVVLSLKDLKSFKRRLLEQTVEILRNRIDALGVVQPVITYTSGGRVLVELPGYLDIRRAKKFLGKTASLSLHLVLDSSYDREALKKKLNKETLILPSRDGREFFLVSRFPIIRGSDLKDAYQSFDEFGSPAVSFELKGYASKKFEEFTQRNVGKRLAIVLDNRVISAPVIRERISGGRGQISGSFTLESAKDLALLLKSGSLPTNLKFLEERVLGPSLGKRAIRKGIISGLIGFVLLCLVLLLRYKLVGVGAIFSILLNALYLWGGLSLLSATLTLPGIAGIILNMGMAVDSNVLIYERIKEELKLGNTLKKAIDLGYRRSWSAVFDTHMTLLVASVILYQFGTGPVKGFATTLMIGTVGSFLSNVYFSKLFLELFGKKGF